MNKYTKLGIISEVLKQLLSCTSVSVEYFIAIVPPKKYAEKIKEFQKRWSGNTLPDFVEPHVTVKSQAGLNEDECWIDSIKTICSTFPMFNLSIRGVKSFGNSVVYLGVDSHRINELHRRIVGAIHPDPEISKRYYELDLYEPHLTLGSKEYGMSEIELSEMMNLANKCFPDFQPFIVKSLNVYKLLGNKYQKIQKLELMQTRSVENI